MASVKSGSLLDEEWREYEWLVFGDELRTYRINNPSELYVGTTTHRVVDVDGIVHCVPNVGHMGCVLRWKNKPGKDPVAF